MSSSPSLRSLYARLAAIIIASVVAVLGGNAVFNYVSQRQAMIEALHQSSALSIASLQQNIAGLIEAYAVSDYGDLIATEIEMRKHFAILVHDHNMGRVLGQDRFTTGKIQSPSGQIVDYEPTNPEHRQWLALAEHTESAPILAASGESLGSVAVYNTHSKMAEALKEALRQHMFNTLGIATLLIILLLLAIRQLVIRPLAQLTQVLGKTDQDGIPTSALPHWTYREMAPLVETMNTMLGLIQHSRASLRAEHEALQQSLKLNRLIIETLPDLLWLKDVDGRYLMCNPRFEAFIGAPEADIVGKTDFDLVDRAQAEFFRLHDRMAMNARQPTMNEEWVTFASDGRQALLETTKVAMLRDDGQIAGVLGVGHDTTERYQVNCKLQAILAREEALNQALPVGVVVYDEALESIAYANPSAANMLETSSRQLIGGTLDSNQWRIVHRENEDGTLSDHPRWITPDTDKTPESYVLCLAFAERLKWIGVQTRPFFVNGALAGVIVAMTDISAERQTIQALDLERKRFQLAIEGAQDGLWDRDLITNKVFFSDQWKRMLGYDPLEIGDSFAEWESRVHIEDLGRVMEAIQAHLRGETAVYESRHRLRCKDGEWKWFLDRGKALFDDQGMALRMVGFHSDITREIRYQEELAHSAKHDPLTLLPNRFLFNELIQNLMHRCKRNNKKLALVYIDLDGFKQINDTFGHEAGDMVLITTAQRMKSILRQEDMVARLGGDEFVVAIADLDKREAARPLLKRLLHDISQPVPLFDGTRHELHVSASMGVSLYPQSLDIGPEALLRQADQAMYEAKNAGKNQFRFFKPDNKPDPAFRPHDHEHDNVRTGVNGQHDNTTTLPHCLNRAT
ncbi:MAG: diguanylate cyclase domain-containing protein [Pseudomonadota bacterium]